MNVLIEEIKNKIFKLAKEMGFTDYEIYIQKDNQFSVNILNGDVREFKNSKLQGIGFRGIYDGKMGYSFSEKVDTDIIDLLLTNAKDNSEIIESVEEEILFDGKVKYDLYNGMNEKLEEVEVSTKIEMAKKIEAMCLEKDKRVKMLPHCLLCNGLLEIIILNSKGLDVSSKTNYCYAVAYVNVEENGENKVNGDVWIGNDFDDLDISKFTKDIVEKAVAQLGAKKVKSGNYEVIFENKVMADFLETFKSNFYGYNVDKGLSKLKNKIDEKISSELITLVDTGIYKTNMSNRTFDDEGVKTEKTTLIENGVLKNYLYTLKMANKKGVKPTGNGFKSNFKSMVSTSNTNLYIEESKNSKEDLLNNVGDGIYITSLSGLHSGANSISGDFSLIASGFMINKGKITNPIEQFTVAGNFYDVLKNVKMIGSDMKFTTGAVGTPSIHIGKLSVAGE